MSLAYCEKQKTRQLQYVEQYHEARTDHEVTAFNEVAAERSFLQAQQPPPIQTTFNASTGTTTSQTVEIPMIQSAHHINMHSFHGAGHNHGVGWAGADVTTTATCPPGFMWNTPTAACTPADSSLTACIPADLSSTACTSAGWRQPASSSSSSSSSYTFISQSYGDTTFDEFGARGNRWKTVPHGPDQKLVAVKYYPDEPDRLRDKCCYQLPYDMFTWKQHVRTGRDRHIESYRQLDENHHECKVKPTIKMRGAGWGTDLDFCEEHSIEAFEWHKAVMDNEINYEDLLWTVQKITPAIFDTRQAVFDLEKNKREHERQMRLLQADEKADRLLKKWLSPDEYKSLKETGLMEYQSKKDTDTIYIIRKEYSRKVTKRVKGIDTEELCVMPVTPLCNDDNLLSKIMLLKTDEDQFLKTANHFPLVERTRPRREIGMNGRDGVNSRVGDISYL